MVKTSPITIFCFFMTYEMVFELINKFIIGRDGVRNVKKMLRRTKRRKNKTDEELRKHNEKDDGRKKRRMLNHAARRSRSKEDELE